MCKHERLAKIDTFWRCRDCGEIFNEPPKAVKAEKAEEIIEAEEKKPAKKPAAKKGAK
jgi:ribosomal protein L37AE/L43A